MAKCELHNKENVGFCQWCGKQLCKLCVGKRLGKKLFCSECGMNLSPIIERRQLEIMRKDKEKIEKEREFKKIMDI